MNEQVNDYRRQRQIRWETAADIKTIWIFLIVAWVLFLIPICFVNLVAWILNWIAFKRCLHVINKGNKIGGLVPLLSSVTLSPIIFIIGVLMTSLILEPKTSQPVEPPQQKQIQPAQPRAQSTSEISV